MKKICPLLLMSGYGAGFNPSTDSNLCVEEECAWWCGTTYMGEPNGGNCAIFILATKPLNVSIAR